jgi:2-oxoglutarate ferredoxin oxidoreductase subunit beta
MNAEDFGTKEKNTWCPGCPNFLMLEAFKEAMAELVSKKKIEAKDAVVAAGIGCHGKIFDYLNLNGFYCLHGRLLPTALGIKFSNPNLTVFGIGGDGDTYAEGVSHFVHACRNNPDLKLIVHDNQVFALTVGQATPTSEKGFVGSANPLGVKEKPLNPLLLALASGAGFVARGFAMEKEHLKDLICRAVDHKGFAFIDVLQPCIVFHNVIPYLKKNIYKLDETHDYKDFNRAREKAGEWDYCFDKDSRIPIGVFYQAENPVLDDDFPQKKIWHEKERKTDWEKLIKNF